MESKKKSDKEEKKLGEILTILINAVDEMEVMIFNIESELLENVNTVEDVVSKKAVCTTIITLARLLKDFPKRSPYQKKPFQTTPTDPRVLDFMEKMDKAIFTIKSKFEVIREFIKNTTSLTNALTLALILRDAKKVLLQEPIEEESEEQARLRRESINEIESKRRSIEPPEDIIKKEENEQGSNKNGELIVDDDDKELPKEAVEKKVTEAILQKKGTLRMSSRQSGESSSIITSKDVFNVPVTATASTSVSSSSSSLSSLSSSTKAPKDAPNNYAEAVESILSVKDDTLESVMKDTTALKLFKGFLKKEFAEDNVLFYEDISKYRQMKQTDKNLRKKGDELFDKYIKEGASMEINLPGAIKKEIIESFKKNIVTNTTFDRAQKSVFHLMENDSFTRFRKSEDWKLYMKSKGYQKINMKGDMKHRRQTASMSWLINTLGNEDQQQQEQINN